MPETKLIEYLEKYPIPQAHLARAMGITRDGFNKKLYGKGGNRFSQKQREIIATKLREDYAVLFPEAEAINPDEKVQVVA